MGLAKPGRTCWLTGTCPGLASQDAAGQVFGLVWNRTKLLLRSEPGLLDGYPDLLLTLVVTRHIYRMNNRMQWTSIFTTVLRFKLRV